MNNALKFLSGSAVTYMLMAACSAGPNRLNRTAEASAGAGASNGRGAGASIGGAASPDDSGGATMNGSGGAVAEGGGGSLIDAMMDPVSEAAAEPATDGTRLKAEFQVGTDGSKQFGNAWWDSERGEECTFMASADGTLRCMPSGWAAAAAFADSGCTVPLFVAVKNSCATPKYGLAVGPVNCGAYPVSVFSLTPTDPAIVFTGKPGACTDGTAALKPTYDFYSGTAVPLSSFVSATKQHA